MTSMINYEYAMPVFYCAPENCHTPMYVGFGNLDNATFVRMYMPDPATVSQWFGWYIAINDELGALWTGALPSELEG